MAKIAEFPTELLLEIVSQLDPDDFVSAISLALASRRLYTILAPMVHEGQSRLFSCLLESNDSGLRIIERTDTPTTGLTEDLDPFTETMEKVELALHGDQFAVELQAILGVISRARHLQSVEIVLRFSISERQVAHVINICAGIQDIRLAVRGGISSRRGPFQYKIFYTNPQTSRYPQASGLASTPAYQGNARNSSRRLHVFRSLVNERLQSLLNFWARLREEPASVERPSSPIHRASVEATLEGPKFLIANPPRGRLSSLNIRTDSLFLPSLYPVTLNLLNQSSIHTLSISHLTLTLYSWAKILPAITMPFLRSLSINDTSMAFPDLLAFLDRHEGIEALDLTGNDLIGVVQLPPKRRFLHNLFSLKAHSEFQVPFLRHKRDKCFPSLKNFFVTGPEIGLDAFYDVLSEGHFMDLTITLEGRPFIALVEWLLNDKLDRKGNTAMHQLVGVNTLTVHLSERSLEPHLKSWIIDDLNKWGIDQNFRVNQRREKQLDVYLQISEALVRSASPQLKNMVYHFV